MKLLLPFLLLLLSSLAHAADDVYVTCSVSPCTIVHQIDLPPFQLDTADGALVAGAVLGVWAIGWAFRMLIVAMRAADIPPADS